MHSLLKENKITLLLHLFSSQAFPIAATFYFLYFAPVSQADFVLLNTWNGMFYVAFQILTDLIHKFAWKHSLWRYQVGISHIWLWMVCSIRIRTMCKLWTNPSFMSLLLHCIYDSGSNSGLISIPIGFRIVAYSILKEMWIKAINLISSNLMHHNWAEVKGHIWRDDCTEIMHFWFLPYLVFCPTLKSLYFVALTFKKK